MVDTLRQGAKQHGGEDKLKLKKLESELKEIDCAETKLFEAIEKGIIDLDDRLKGRIQQHKTRRDTITGELVTLQRKCQTPLQTITPHEDRGRSTSPQ